MSRERRVRSLVTPWARCTRASSSVRAALSSCAAYSEAMRRWRSMPSRTRACCARATPSATTMPMHGPMIAA